MADDKDFVPGSMNIEAQEKAFESFINIVTRSTIVILVFLVFLAMING
ncbi:MAG: aa3-type cytochrome c oxidase subunit IV [Pseudomonadota bacterium]